MGVPLERKELILRWLERVEFLTVAELADKLRVSSATIRRDLAELAKEGLLVRTHGGAMSRSRFALEPPYQAKEVTYMEEKRRIGRQASALVQDGEAIFINAGTTALELARNLKQRQELTVMTNGVNVALELLSAPDILVILTGGILREKTLALAGPLAEQSVRDLRVTKAFLGVNSVDLRRGIAMYSQMEAEANKAFVEIAEEITVIVDASKFHTTAFALIAPLTSIHRVITDNRVTLDIVEHLQAHHIEVIVV